MVDEDHMEYQAEISERLRLTESPLVYKFARWDIRALLSE